MHKVTGWQGLRAGGTVIVKRNPLSGRMLLLPISMGKLASRPGKEATPDTLRHLLAVRPHIVITVPDTRISLQPLRHHLLKQSI